MKIKELITEDNKYWKTNRNNDIGYNKAIEDIINLIKS